MWVASTGPFAVNRIDPKTNTRVARVELPGEACAGLVAGAGSIWLIIDKLGSLARIDPANGAVLDTFHVPAGSYNPAFLGGTPWVTHADGADVTGIDAASGKTIATVVTGPNPRFLSVGAGAVWTLNQGDGTLMRG